MRRFLSVFLAVLMILTATVGFFGCNKKKTEQPLQVIETTAGTVEGDTYVAPNVNYGGKEFNVFTWSLSEDWVDELTPEMSNIDAQTYRHLRNVESELGIAFNIAIREKGGYNEIHDFISKIQILTGEDNIDLICQYSLAASVGAQQDLYTNLQTLNYITWDADYWSGSLTQENTINGKMFYGSGDMTGSVVKNMFLMAFNRSLSDAYEMGNLYDVVRSGDWTIEKLKELSATVYQDDNLNNTKDVGDTFGLVVGEYNTIDAFQYGANLRCLKVNDSGELEINPELCGDRGISITDKLKEMLYSNEGAYCATKTVPSYADAMQTGKAVFYPMIAETIIDSLSGTDINYGVLPIPKYEKSQENYHTTLGMMYSMFSVPKVAADPDMSAAVMESMAHDGYVNLNPVIYDALKYRYAKDSEDIEMFEILRDGIIYDSGRILEFIDIFALVRRTVRDNSPLVSYYKAQEDVFIAGVKEANFMFS